jgi:hypothetical protein
MYLNELYIIRLSSLNGVQRYINHVYRIYNFKVIAKKRLDYTKRGRVCSRRRRSKNYTSLGSSRPYEPIETILEVIQGQLENSTFFDLISRISIRALFNKKNITNWKQIKHIVSLRSLSWSLLDHFHLISSTWVSISRFRHINYTLESSWPY